MKTTHSTSIGLQRGAFRPMTVSAAVSACLAMIGAVQARAGADDQLEEIVVSGYRASLENSLQRKREATQVIESVTAEDIGKFPDQNVAESLQRLPGVQIDRAGGQGTAVLIDGLRQNLTTLNGETFLTGREFYVSGEASGGGAGSNSQTNSLEGIPSEQISGIDVIKNPNAANSEGGLGGIIDLKTRSPLAQHDGLNLAVLARGTQAADAEGSVTPIVSGVIGYKWSENFAVTASVAYDNQKTHIKEFQDQNRSEWRITNSAQNGNYVGSPTAATLGTINEHYIVPQLAYFSDNLDDREFLSATVGVEWRWNDSIRSNLLWFYTDNDYQSTTYSNKAWFNGQGAAPGTLFPALDPSKPYEIDDNGVVVSGTFNANGAETATLQQHTKTKANNFQFVTSFDNGGAWSGTGTVAYASSPTDYEAAQADIEHGLYNYRTPSGGSAPTSPAAPGCNNGGSSCTDGNHGYQFTWGNGGSSGLPSISYPTDVLSNPAYTTFKSNWAWANQTDQDNFAIKGDLKFVPTFTSGLTLNGGIRYAGRDIDQTFGRYLIDGATAGIGGVPAGSAAGNCCFAAGQSGTFLYYSDPGYATIPFAIAGTLPPGSYGKSVPSLAMSYTGFASGVMTVKDPKTGGMMDPATYLNTLWTQAGVPNNTEAFFPDTLSSFRLEERTTALYVMGSVGDAASHYHLDAGVRLVNTQLDIHNSQSAPVQTWHGTASWNGVNANNQPVEHSRSYTDVLPSFNFTLDLTDSQKLRLGAARVVSPQNPFQLGVGNSYNFTRGADGPGGQARFKFANGSSGNPELDPYRASQFLLSYENYFARGAIVSAGVFYKAVDNFVETQNIPTLVADDFGGSVGNVNQPVNAGKGKIYGVEIGAQYSFEFGLGFTGNYTYSNSTSDQETAFAEHLPIPGVSRNSFNVTAFYEHFGFSARLAYSWRSNAVNDSLVGATFSFPDQTGTQQVYGVYSAAYGQLDGQVGYDFTENFGLVLSANNLTNQKQHTYLQFTNLPFTYDDSGTRYYFGVKARF